MTVCTLPVVNGICAVATAALGSVGTAIINQLASAFAAAQAEMLTILIGAWVYVPTPDLSSGGTVGFLQGSLSWYVGAAAVLGLLVAAGRLAWQRRPDAAKVAASGLVRTLLVVGAGVAAIGAASAASDAFSTWILTQAAGGSSGTQALTTMGTLAAGTFASAGLVVILAVLSIIGMVIQVALLLVRSALLVVLAGVWPLSASVSMIDGGQTWFRKITGWLLAMLLYKPAAAIVLSAAIELTTGAGSGELAAVQGIILIVLASVAMPALMRFVVPLVSGAGGVSAAEVAGAGIAAATGAALIVGTGGAAAAGGMAAAGTASGAQAAGSVPGGGGGPASGPGPGPGGGRGGGGTSGGQPGGAPSGSPPGDGSGVAGASGLDDAAPSPAGDQGAQPSGSRPAGAPPAESESGAGGPAPSGPAPSGAASSPGAPEAGAGQGAAQGSAAPTTDGTGGGDGPGGHGAPGAADTRSAPEPGGGAAGGAAPGAAPGAGAGSLSRSVGAAGALRQSTSTGRRASEEAIGGQGEGTDDTAASGAGIART